MTDKIDTQGLTSPSSVINNPLTVPNLDPFNYPIRDVPVRTVFTDEERTELKEIIKEALHEFHNHRI